MSAPNRAKRRQSHEQGNHKPGVSHNHRGFEEKIGGDMEEIIKLIEIILKELNK